MSGVAWMWSMLTGAGTVTLLFTDLEGSSRLWEQSPEQMSVASARHDSIAADLIEKHSGIVFKSLGDGVCAVFPDPADAILAAQDLQLRMSREAWPTETPLKMRIGVHTGEVERRMNDYFGHAVNLVARLVEAGHGGQTLVTRETWHLINRTAGAHLLGRFRLRGMLQSVEIFQLETAYPEASFPALRGTESPPHNLPEQVTSFVGRQTELEEIIRLLENNRLVTLCGMGGSGKTRLSLEIGSRLLSTHDAVWFIEFAPVSEASLVPGTLASALGIQVGSQPVVDAAVEFLKGRAALLVFDNCEQVVEAAAKLADTLLKRVPGLQILASSREGLAIQGEAIYQVPPLPVPRYTRHLKIEDVSGYGAIQLFVDRACAASSEFRLQDQDPVVLSQLCQRLDGIPLAIELAAARIRSMTAEQVLERLDDRFRLLTGGSRAALPRQRTLRALVDWSYDLLNETERDLLTRLSVFVGGCDLGAVEAICTSELVESFEALDLLCSLTEKSLVIQDTRNKGNPRYRLLEMVRHYAQERLIESGDEDVRGLRDRHANFYLDFAENIAPKLVGAEAAKALDRLDEEHDNIRAALNWFAGRKEFRDESLRMVVALQRFWLTRGHLIEGLEHARSSLKHTSTDPSLRTRALFVAAFCAMSLGEIEEARGYFVEALGLAREIGDRIQEGRALSGLAGIAGDFDVDYQTSFDLNRRALGIHQEVGNKLGQAAANYNLADLTIRHDPRLQSIELAASAIEEAEQYFRSGLTLFSDLRDVKHQGICLNGLAIAAQKKADLAAAQAYFVAALELFQEVSDNMWLGNLYKSLAWLHWQLGNEERALLLAGLGLEQHEIMGFVPPVKEKEWWEGVFHTMSERLSSDELEDLLCRGRMMLAADALKLAREPAALIIVS